MTSDRRTFLAALGLTAPLASPGVAGLLDRFLPPSLRFRTFEEGVRAAFATTDGDRTAGGFPCRRVEVGYSDAVRAGLQGCVNSRPFAGHPELALRIVRTACEPGPVVGGARLLVMSVDVVLTDGVHGGPVRMLDFATLPAAAVLVPPFGLPGVL